MNVGDLRALLVGLDDDISVVVLGVEHDYRLAEGDVFAAMLSTKGYIYDRSKQPRTGDKPIEVLLFW